MSRKSLIINVTNNKLKSFPEYFRCSLRAHGTFTRRGKNKDVE